jgi:hypothetical protein
MKIIGYVVATIAALFLGSVLFMGSCIVGGTYVVPFLIDHLTPTHHHGHHRIHSEVWDEL